MAKKNSRDAADIRQIFKQVDIDHAYRSGMVEGLLTAYRELSEACGKSFSDSLDNDAHMERYWANTFKKQAEELREGLEKEQKPLKACSSQKKDIRPGREKK